MDTESLWDYKECAALWLCPFPKKKEREKKVNACIILPEPYPNRAISQK